MEIEQLIHLIAFYEHKTLSDAAKALHTSQPVLTRSMKKLEEDLEIPLFERSKNRITLNETGLQAVEYAKRILNDTENMKVQLKEFDRRQHTFSIGSVAPAPGTFLSQKASLFYQDKIVSNEIKDMDILIQGIKDQTYTVIVMPQDIDDEYIESIPFMEEKLYFSLPFDHPLAQKKSIQLKEMDGERMLLMSNVGFWYQICRDAMPHTKFLIQQDRSVFYDLIELSSLPSFTSSYTMKADGIPENRVIIPIEDEKVQVTFYCWYLKENEKALKSFLYHLS
jgi:DNA-binding transcriptional LysR family regulator